MRNLTMIVVAILIMANFSFGQVSYQETTYDSLSAAGQKLFSDNGNKNSYGDVVKTKVDSVIMVIKVTGIKKSRKMVTDSTGSRPKLSEQFMIIYETAGKRLAFVSITDPRVNGNTSADIAALMSNTGLGQGDDPSLPNFREMYQ